MTVSLTFDDGIIDHNLAGSLLAERGMRGTFYLNSGRLGATGYLSGADARALEAQGHEIAGHTVSHADLPTLSLDEQKRQVCDDRSALLAAGLRVTSFAYPYGARNAQVEEVVQGCGYNSARRVGDIVSPGTCSGCPYAETIPPRDLWAIDTPVSIKESTSLEDMMNYVLQAEQNGGGWVPLVLHRVCDACDTNRVSASQLGQFLDWLGARSPDGTVVKTVDEVIGGNVKPGVVGPVAPPPGDLSNLVRNPSMETDSDGNGLPDCFQRGGFGTNTYVYGSAPDVRTGSAAQRVDVTSYTSGDRKIITPQDLGACAPPTREGHRYQFTGWYKTNADVRVSAFYRTSSGGWTFLGQSPLLPRSEAAYAQASWVTPSMPAGSTAISIGYSIRSAGYVQADDFSLADVDQTLPSVDITSPADGSRVRGQVSITASASDASGVDRVEILVDGAVICTIAASPYTCSYDSTLAPDSVIAVTARAYDTAGNVASSTGREYTVSNSVPLDETPPSVQLESPTDGTTVQQVVTLQAAASDDDAVSQVLFSVNGVNVANDNERPYEVPWDSTSVPDGTVTITAVALDRSGNTSPSSEVQVVVDNKAMDATAPVSSANCNGTSCSTGWYSTAVTVALSASDEQSGVDVLRYTLDGTDPSGSTGQAYAGPFRVDASTVVRFYAVDNAGNSEAPQQLSLLVDVVAPVVAITAPTSGATVSGSAVYITTDVSDNVGVTRVWYYLDGKALGSRIAAPWRWKWNASTVSKGAHTLLAVAFDAAGNRTSSEAVSVTVA